MPEKNPIKIIIAEDHQSVSQAFSFLIGTDESFLVVGEVASGEALLDLLPNQNADVIIMDINMPGMGGIQATREVKSRFPGVKILAVTTYKDTRTIHEAVKAGVNGYVPKTSDVKELKEAIRTLASGDNYFNSEIANKLISIVSTGFSKEKVTEAVLPEVLTKREREILRYIAMEYKGREIAKALHISVNTVETHRKNLVRKLNVRNTQGLVAYAIRNGIA